MNTETTDEIIAATGRALCECGYADLTMQRIAKESSLTTAAIHYHFDTKSELLNAFLDDLIERFQARLACEAEDPRERLTTFVDAVFTPSASDDDFPVALMELKAQAPYHDGFRERFCDLDDVMRRVVATAVRDGIDAGHFEEADPEAVARLVTTAINGAHVRRVALGEDGAETRATVERYLELQLGWTPNSEVTA
ncbi:TetR family transcriptional regulator [Salinigranum rubrum]|uniref:TetR family transcriptional regulator n=1 Tax=Salinigranum rubrum TaxID=755307 RepID=A0A2I8VLL1_9EURY|nr:TetR/AcrR family transcriptional regulator [Salinigranum rubrum]AUV82774.1 TetR family transcriptional regulator [Salinigranum rubrum]